MKNDTSSFKSSQHYSIFRSEGCFFCGKLEYKNHTIAKLLY